MHNQSTGKAGKEKDQTVGEGDDADHSGDTAGNYGDQHQSNSADKPNNKEAIDKTSTSLSTTYRFVADGNFLLSIAEEGVTVEDEAKEAEVARRFGVK